MVKFVDQPVWFVIRIGINRNEIVANKRV